MQAETIRYSKQQEPEGHLSVVDNNDLLQVQTLQAQWDTALGRKKNAPGQFENYNPVIARWGFDRLVTSEQRQQFRVNELQNITTALRERNHTHESRLTLSIGKDKKIHNEVFPDSSYEDVLERGRRYRAENGSQETEREQAEIKGFLKIQDALTSDEAKVGTKFFVISPPGLTEDTPYIHNFVDSYELVENAQGERSVRYTRFASPLEYNKYREIAEGFDSQYFEGQSGPLDAWYLENPILVPADSGNQTTDDVFVEHFAKDVKAMEEEKFQELWKIYSPYALYYLDQLTKVEFDPVKIAEAYNALLLSTEDEDMHRKAQAIDIFVASQVTELSSAENQRIAAMVGQYGRKEVKAVKAGCGRSGGFSFDGGGAGSVFAANSVVAFGIGSGGGNQEWFNCPKCQYQADGPIGDTCPGCDLTKDEFAATGGEVC